MKKIVALLLCAVTLIGLCSCGSVSDVDVELSQPIETTETQSETTQHQETEPFVTSAFLSNRECDIVLASGYDENGAMYELVANEYEDYTGTTIEVGVIKDNKWFVEPTSDSPFTENGGLFYYDVSISDIEKDVKNGNRHFKYIGNGCFAYDNYIIYNSLNQKSINLHEIDGDCYASLDYGSHSYINDRDNMVLVDDMYGSNLCVLNTLTMEIIEASFDMYSVHAYGDGLFCAREGMTSDYKFYNLDGAEVLNLSDYGKYIYYTDWNSSYGKYETVPVFSEGKCTFYTQNDQDSVYKITIDKQGNVLESEKVK
ncbi:MAG: hypothetical protein IJO03_03175 [Clostridia bacterium]|nr:hypothetical protein [Clostridia bacterium]